MENIQDRAADTNVAELTGEIITDLKFSHKTYGEAFYEMVMGINRKSGCVDEINIMASERLIWEYNLKPGNFIRVLGQIRTYNEDENGRSRLNIVVFARELELMESEEHHKNNVYLQGFVCKPPIRRTSPLGREICDIMLAVNRMYNKSDYIPCIAWGRNAAYGGSLGVGAKIAVTGRIQSREYKKRDADGNAVSKVAYEVSVLKIEE